MALAVACSALLCGGCGLKNTPTANNSNTQWLGAGEELKGTKLVMKDGREIKIEYGLTGNGTVVWRLSEPMP